MGEVKVGVGLFKGQSNFSRMLRREEGAGFFVFAFKVFKFVDVFI
jgi:hypothetical protein